jgi:hypothetical protein
VRTHVAFILISVFAIINPCEASMFCQSAPGVTPFAFVSIQVDKHKFKSGDKIELTILLEAGPGGVYIPKTWGEYGGGLPGFAVRLTTLTGKGAETCGYAADAFPTHEPDPKVALNRDFVYLGPNQIIGRKTSIVCPTKQPGKYLIEGFYAPNHIDVDRVAELPETHGLVLREAVHADPVPITIY